MIGRDYFDLRSRLDAALTALEELSSECSNDCEQSAAIVGLIDGLKKPFSFVVIGDVNADKPAFLKALSGAEFFQDCSIVDLPVASPVDNGHLKTAARCVSQADIVIVLFTAMHPWDAPAWHYLEQIHPHLPVKVIVVLQHSDQRDPEELQPIVAYMKRLCARRFNREFPVFPVSANRACLARGTGLDGERLLAESGFQNLEQHVSGIISGGGSQHKTLSKTLKAARKILSSLQHKFEKKSELRVRQAGNFRKIDAELAAQAQRTFDRISDVTGSAADELRLAVQNILVAASAQFKMRAVLQNLFRKNRTSGGINPLVQSEFAGADQKRWDHAATVLQNDVSAMADQVRKHLEDGPDAQAGGELKLDAVFWAAQRGRFLAQANGIRQRAFSTLNISHYLSPALESLSRLARRQWLLTAIWIMAAIILGVSGSWILAGLATGAAVLTIFVCVRAQSKLLARTLAESHSHLSKFPVNMKHLLDQQLRDETENLFEQFNSALRPTRRKLEEEERLQMLIYRQMENVGRILDDLDAELRLDPTPAS